MKIITVVSVLILSTLLSVSATLAQFLDFDKNGFVAEAKVEIALDCVRKDGVRFEGWKGTALGHESYQYVRITYKDKVVVEEETSPQIHNRIRTNDATIVVEHAVLSSRYSPMNIRDTALEDIGLRQWKGCTK